MLPPKHYIPQIEISAELLVEFFGFDPSTVYLSKEKVLN